MTSYVPPTTALAMTAATLLLRLAATGLPARALLRTPLDSGRGPGAAAVSRPPAAGRLANEGR